MKQKKASLWTRDFIVVIAATFFTGIVMGILDSCLAPFANDMFSSKTLGGYLTSLFNLGSIIMAFFSGRFVDLRGRKKMFFVGAIIFAIPTFVCAAFPTPTVSLTTRFIQGLGKAIVGVAGASIVADIVPADRLGDGGFQANQRVPPPHRQHRRAVSHLYNLLRHLPGGKRRPHGAPTGRK